MNSPVRRSRATEADTPAAAPRSAESAPPEPPAGTILTPVEIAILVLASIAVVASAKIAEAVLVPLVAGILIAYTLRPGVNALENLRVPRWIGATVVMAALLGVIGGSAYALGDEVDSALAELPHAARKIRVAFEREAAEKPGALAHVKEAAKELDRAVEAPTRAAGEVPPPIAPAAAPAPAAAGGAQVQAFIAKQTAGALEVAAQLGVALILAFLLLLSGDAFRRKCIRLAGESLARRRVTVAVLNEIDAQVQSYMLILIWPNIMIAVLTWLALAALGVPNAGLLGVFVGASHVLPYVGTVLGATAVGAASLVSDGSLGEATIAVGVVLVISTAIGMGLVTWLQGRACRMNVVAVFVGLMFFGWLWGGWGLVLGVPLMAVLKSIADRVDAMKPISEMLAG